MASIVADGADLPIGLAGQVVGFVFEQIAAELVARRDFTLPGVGRLSVERIPSRNVYRPFTYEPITTPESRMIKLHVCERVRRQFKISPTLKMLHENVERMRQMRALMKRHKGDIYMEVMTFDLKTAIYEDVRAGILPAVLLVDAGYREFGQLRIIEKKPDDTPTGRELTARITHVHRDSASLVPGRVMLVLQINTGTTQRLDEDGDVIQP
jgi:nucleoid DNA-binding protein